MTKIDLHLHSYYSDGTNSPTEILNLVEHSDISLFSITDHNYIAPLVEDFRIQRARFIQGVEISVFDRTTEQSLHILGYSSGFAIEEVNHKLAPTIAGYNKRAERIVDRLNKRFGSNFDFANLREQIPGSYVSRNLLAVKLKDFLSGQLTMEQAVKECFAEEENTWMLTAEEAIGIITDGGGMAVLAHPGNLLAKLDIDKLVERLVGAGLRGIEVYYPRHDTRTIAILTDLASSYNLLVTGGSDWHGETHSKSPLGVEIPEPNYTSLINCFDAASLTLTS